VVVMDVAAHDLDRFVVEPPSAERRFPGPHFASAHVMAPARVGPGPSELCLQPVRDGSLIASELVKPFASP
jgi:hypothetical protein